MSTISDKTGLCLQVEENLADVLEGSASAALYDHIAECDTCRDLRYDAERAAEVVKHAAADFRAPAGFAESLLAKIDAARPNGPVAPQSSAGSLAGGASIRSAAAAGDGAVAAGGTVRIASPSLSEKGGAGAADAGSVPRVAGQPAPSTLAEALPRSADLDIATAPTTLAPVDSAKTDRSARDEAPVQSGKRPAEPAAHETARSVERASDARPARSTEVLESAPQMSFNGEERKAKATEPGAPSAEPAKSEKIATAKPAGSAADKGAPGKGGKVIPFYRRPMLVASAAIAMAAAAAAGFYMKGRAQSPEVIATEEPWSGKVASVARASSDKTGGFEVCDADGQSCSPVNADTAVAQGVTLRTDARTRARVSLADGTWVALDRDTELAIAKGKDRAAKLVRGSIVADVANVPQAAPARFAFDTGSVEVLGTKLQITAAKDRASVEVARGSVRVLSNAGKSVEVRAGEEATLLDRGEPVVASSSSLADVMEWSDQSQEEVDSPVLRGLGELRARKPGETKERDRAVRLTKHAVKVRVVDLVARTEIDETFTNDTDEELEGIFRFPLPPGAQIEGLALDVNGQMEPGAFVDRDKGAAIWRGVIQNAAPKAPRQREEIIWVPGPWRDPALLEWQRGGRFELRVFPIPKRSSRRVQLTYTQLVDQSGGVRRFTYPLAHDTNGTTKIDSFDMDVQVLGHDKELGVTARGYALNSLSGEGAADRRAFHADNFTPSGDLTIEYALPDRDKEVTAWAYRMDPAQLADLASAAAGPAPASAAGKAAPSPTVPPAKGTPDEKAAIEAARAIAGDTSPYVAIAVRPKLPRWTEQKDRTHVIVVDTSRSMIGERFARARRLATTIVKEMDRRDSFVLLACDTTCRGPDGSIAPKPQAPGAAAAADVEKFLSSVEPDGGSDLAASISAARAAAGSARDRELRVIYLGDGTPTVGPTRASHLETAVRAAMPPGDGAIVAVPLGADSDTTSLQAMARGGGGVMVPYVPGQKVSTAALEVLSAAYGVVLRDPEIELPQGLTQVTPSRLDPIRAGGESIIVARMAVDGEVSGQIKLRGRVSGERFEQTYPVKVVPTSSGGNAFVPRLFAAAKIAELERAGGDLAKPMIVELSKRFAVASQFTSMIVLESPAMFKAFGLDRGSIGPKFTGEEGARSESADADGEQDPAADAADESERAASGDAKKEARKDDDFGLGMSGPGAAGGTKAAPNSFGGPAASAAAEAPAPAATMAPPAKVATKPKGTSSTCPPGDPFCFDDLNQTQPTRRPPVRPRPLIPMKRIFERRAGFEASNTVVAEGLTKLAAAETALQAQPDSRDKTAALYALYATMGRLGEAQELTARWATRDALDPDALLARADLAVRQGDRERAVRILGGLADVRPGDKAIQSRLADLYEAALNPSRACAHRLAIADLATTDAKAVAAAVTCARASGMSDLADAIRRDVDDKTRDAVDKAVTTAVAAPQSATAVRGDVQVTADWNGAADLDVALIDNQGKRMSWLGGTNSKVTVSALNATSTRGESLGFLGLGSGSYVVEVTRAAGADPSAFTTPVSGELTLRLPNGVTRKVPFTLNGARAEVGTIRVFFESRLVPVEGGFGGWGPRPVF